MIDILLDLYHDLIVAFRFPVAQQQQYGARTHTFKSQYLGIAVLHGSDFDESSKDGLILLNSIILGKPSITLVIHINHILKSILTTVEHATR